MIHQRLPDVADREVQNLSDREDPGGCLGELRGVAIQLDRQGFVGRPEWHSLRMGVRPQGIFQAEPGECRTVGNTTLLHLPNTLSGRTWCWTNRVPLTKPTCAHIQDPGASDALSVCPSKQEYRIEAGLFRTLILERLRLPLQVTEKVCECGTMLDSTGRHRAACNRSGRLKKRALAPERTLARVCREAGATVRCNAKLCDMNLAVAANDDRAIEVLASGLPLFFGAQLAVDSTVRCALAADGTAQPGAARVDGAVCTRAREDKERTYSELLRGDRCRLVVVACSIPLLWHGDVGGLA